MTSATSEDESRTVMRVNRWLQRAGLLIVGLLVVLAIATVLGIQGAGRGAIAVIMLGASLLGIQTAVEQQALGSIAAALLIVSGLGGTVVTATGGNPFQRWEIIGPMAIGLAITFWQD